MLLIRPRMSSSPLRALLRRAVHASVVAPLALTACGPDTTGYQAPACEGGRLAVTGLAPAVIPDVVELRQRFDFFGDEPSSPSVASTAGTACATATDKPACDAAFTALSPDAGFGRDCLQLCTSYFLATTKADEVKAWETLEQLKAFLGTIDTGQEAALLTLARGYTLECGRLDRGGVKARPAGGFDVIATRGLTCGPGTQLTRFFLEVTPAGDVVERRSEVAQYGDPNCAIGRRPAGLTSSGRTGCAGALGRHFASAAHLEAASLDAFVRLRDELWLHGAGDELRGAAFLSALEEVRHAQVTSALAARFGASVATPRVESRPLRSLLEVALDNAVEGCVRETYGALVAHHQARHAQDPEVRAVMARIAEDETRHAELSWDIAAWADSRLSPAEREAVRRARRAAVEMLRDELARPVDPALVEVAGLPEARSALAMLEVMLQGLPALA